MKAYFSLLLTLGAVFVCNFPTTTAANDDTQTSAVYPYLIFEPAIESIDNLYRAILGLYRSCIIALRKFFAEKLGEARNVDSQITNSTPFTGLYKFQIWRDQNHHYTGSLQEMIFYMQREVNEAESNLEIIIKYFSALADGTVPPPEELSPEIVKIIITTWVNLQDSISKLGYDVDVFRSYVAAKIESLKIRYGERTFEFHAGMKIICHEVDMRSLYWVKIVGPVFRKALTLPQASYSIVNLEKFYADWPTFLNLPPEATIVEISIQTKAISNTIHNAAQVYFFQSISMRLKIESWPYLNLIFQDSANIKRFVDRGFTRVESYMRSSLNRIQEEINAENYDQANIEMQNVKVQVESDVKVFVDFAETSYRRIYDALYANYFDTYATDLRYTNAFQNLLWYLVDQGFVINWPQNEFATIYERVTIVNLTDSDYLEVTHYSKSNFRSIGNTNYSGNDLRYLQPSLNAYHLILHENLLLDIISTYQTLLNNLRNTLPQNNASKVILINLREDAILFAQAFQYLRLYVSQSGLFIDWIHVESVEEYIHLLTQLDLDVLHRLDILAYRVQSTFQRALDYLHFVNFGTQSLPIAEVPQEEVPFESQLPPVENSDVQNTYSSNYRPPGSASPNFWMERRLLNIHGKLPYFELPETKYGKSTVTQVTPTNELPTKNVPIENIDRGLTNGGDFSTDTLQIVPSLPTVTAPTPRRISNAEHFGKRQHLLQTGASRLRQPVIQNPNITGNGLVPEAVTEELATGKNIPHEEAQTPPIRQNIPTARFLNEMLFGKRLKIIFHENKKKPSQLVTNPSEVVPEGNIIPAEEPILPTDSNNTNSNQDVPSTASLNENTFGKRQGTPTPSQQTLKNSDVYEGNEEGKAENNIELSAAEGKSNLQPTVIPSTRSLNENAFGKTQITPISSQGTFINSPAAINPTDNYEGKEEGKAENNAEFPAAEEEINLQPTVIPSARSLNENAFGKTQRTPISSQATFINSPAAINPTDNYEGKEEGKAENNAEFPAAEEEINLQPTVIPSARSLNENAFGKTQRTPISSQATFINSPAAINPTDNYEGKEGGKAENNAEFPAAEEEFNLQPTVIPSARSLNENAFGKTQRTPISSQATFVNSPAAINPTDNYEGKEGGKAENNAEFPVAEEEFNLQPTVVSSFPGDMNGVHFGKTQEIPRSLPQATADINPDQMSAVDTIGGDSEREFNLSTVDNGKIPKEQYVEPYVNNMTPEQGQFIQSPVTNINGTPEEELISLPAEYENNEEQEEYNSSVDHNTSEDESVSPFRSGNTVPNQEEVAAALDLLSDVYQAVDVNNDGTEDILILNPDQVHGDSLFAEDTNNNIPVGNASSGFNEDTIIKLDQNREERRRRESTLEGSGYFDQSGILHGGNMSGTQHEEAEINSDTLGLIDYQSDGIVDAAFEDSTNQLVNKDENFVILGDLNPEDGVNTNTVMRTSLTTEETTSLVTYVLGEEGQQQFQNTQQ